MDDVPNNTDLIAKARGGPASWGPWAYVRHLVIQLADALEAAEKSNSAMRTELDKARTRIEDLERVLQGGLR